MSADWPTTKAILLEMEGLFNREEDVANVMDVIKMHKEIEQHCATSLADSREIVKQLTSQIAAKEKEIAAPSEEEHAARVAKIRHDIDNTGSEILELKRALNERRSAIANVTGEAIEAAGRVQEETARQITQDDVRRNHLSLFARISNITWDYSPGSSHDLVGTIGDDERKELRRFSFDTKTTSSYEIANGLWDLIEDTYASDSAITA